MKTTTLSTAEVAACKRIQVRSGKARSYHVGVLREGIRRGDKLPPPKCFRTKRGALVFFDGNHTLEALIAEGAREIAVEIHDIDELAARDLAWACNLKHPLKVGLPIVDDDRKERALWLRAHEPTISQREIARRVGVSHTAVAKWVAPSGNQLPDAPKKRVVSRAGKTYVQDTSGQTKAAEKRRAESKPLVAPSPVDLAKLTGVQIVVPDAPGPLAPVVDGPDTFVPETPEEQATYAAYRAPIGVSALSGVPALSVVRPAESVESTDEWDVEIELESVAKELRRVCGGCSRRDLRRVLAFCNMWIGKLTEELDDEAVG